MNIIVDNLKIEYSDIGEGEIVLMLHGWGANKESFGFIHSTLAEKYRVIAMDFPGFGKSDEPPAVWAVDDFANLVVKFVNALSLDRLTLLGHSFGGRVIIKLASRKDLPFEISKIILADSAGILPKRGLSYKIRVGSYKLSKKLMNTALMKKLFPNAIENMQKKRGSADYAAASQIMRGCLVKAVNEDLEPLLSKIKQDTLLIWGTADDATPISDGEKMEKLIPNAGLAKIEGAGHFSWLDNPATFDAIIRSYMKI